jgi:hypothetical protein
MHTGINRILEFSADAHIKRRQVARDSPTFHNLTGAIAAFGKVLELLTALQQPEELGPKPRRFLVATWLHDLGDEGGPVAVMPGPLRRR